MQERRRFTQKCPTNASDTSWRSSKSFSGPLEAPQVEKTPPKGSQDLVSKLSGKMGRPAQATRSTGIQSAISRNVEVHSGSAAQSALPLTHGRTPLQSKSASSPPVANPATEPVTSSSSGDPCANARAAKTKEPMQPIHRTGTQSRSESTGPKVATTSPSLSSRDKSAAAVNREMNQTTMSPRDLTNQHRRLPLCSPKPGSHMQAQNSVAKVASDNGINASAAIINLGTQAQRALELKAQRNDRRTALFNLMAAQQESQAELSSLLEKSKQKNLKLKDLNDSIGRLRKQTSKFEQEAGEIRRCARVHEESTKRKEQDNKARAIRIKAAEEKCRETNKELQALWRAIGFSD